MIIDICEAEEHLGRKGKQLCLIATEGQPCGGCTARRQECTFDLPPLRRHRKQESGSPDQHRLADTSPTIENRSVGESTSVLFGTMERNQTDLTEGTAGLVAPHHQSSLPMAWGRTEPGPSIQPSSSIPNGIQSDMTLPLRDPAYMLPEQNQVSARLSDLWKSC